MKSYIKYPRSAPVGPWSVPALCQAYAWPTGMPGGGTIAIPELGGGHIQSDLEQFCKMIGMPVPTVIDHSVNGGLNNGDPTDPASGEVALDIQVAAAAYWVATQKSAEIHVYNAPNAAESLADATIQAAKDGHYVISWSWGADEAVTRRDGCLAMETAAIAATNMGATVLAAAGDNDSSDGGSSPANVDNPASCPHVVACGGTMKTLSSEVVWNDNPGNPDGEGTGGGYSRVFPMPTWMNGAPHGSGRMVPDIAANAEPRTGYRIILGGQEIVVGGTSAVAPLYAGLLASFGKKLGHIGPQLWSNHMAFNDITQGNNGFYRARPGPDPCTGIGSPIGVRIAKLFVS